MLAAQRHWRILVARAFLVCGTVLLMAMSAAATTIVHEEDIAHMERIRKLLPSILAGGHLCRNGEILLISPPGSEDLQELLIVEEEGKAAGILFQEPPKLWHLADVGHSGDIVPAPSPTRFPPDYPWPAFPEKWPFHKNGAPSFPMYFATPETTGYAIIGKPAPEKPRPPDCIGVMYELRDGGLYCPQQKPDDRPTYTPSMCFVIRESETRLVVRDSQDPDRVLCEMSRPDPGEPSMIDWTHGRRLVWPYMTDNNCPTMPARGVFLLPHDIVIEPVYSYKDAQGKVRRKVESIPR